MVHTHKIPFNLIYAMLLRLFIPSRVQSSGSNVENLPPQVVRKVSKEVVALAEDPPEGIKVFLNEEDITDIQATIEGPREWAGKSSTVPILIKAPPKNPGWL